MGLGPSCDTSVVVALRNLASKRGYFTLSPVNTGIGDLLRAWAHAISEFNQAI